MPSPEIVAVYWLDLFDICQAFSTLFMEMENPWLRCADHGLEYVLPFQGCRKGEV
jgi:hypothetical protein